MGLGILYVLHRQVEGRSHTAESGLVSHMVIGRGEKEGGISASFWEEEMPEGTGGVNSAIGADGVGTS